MYANEYGINSVTIRRPHIVIVFPRELTARRALHMIAAILKVRQLVPPRIKEAFDAGSTMSLGDLYRIFKARPKATRIRDDVLVEMGIPPATIAQLQANLSGTLTMGNAKRAFSHILGELDEVDTAKMHLYIHFLLHTETLQLVPVQHDPPPAEIAHTRDRLPVLFVCTNCYTVRSPKRGSSRSVEEGHYLDNVDFGLTCSGCLSATGIRAVSLMKYDVWGTSMNSPDVPQLHTMCRMCNVVTDYENVAGSPLCINCYKTAWKKLVARRCVCGATFTTKHPACKTFLAADHRDNNKLKIYALCDKHQHILSHAASSFLPLSFYETLIERARV